MNLEKDIRDVIAQNLPQAIGEELRKRLDRADEDARQVKSLTDLCEHHKKSLSEYDAKMRALMTENSGYKKRLEDIEEREKKMRELELLARFEKEKTELCTNMFKTVFANRVVREEQLTKRPIKRSKDQYNCDYVSDDWTDSCESKTTEER